MTFVTIRLLLLRFRESEKYNSKLDIKAYSLSNNKAM